MTEISKKSNALSTMFTNPKPLIGTIHCPPFPGSPRYRGESMQSIIDQVVADGVSYAKGGIDGIIMENAGDIPYLRPEDVSYETVATMVAVTKAVIDTTGIPVGVILLANAALQAVAVAKATGAAFIRANQWVNGYVANEGFIQGDGAKVLRYRNNIGANDVRIFADVHVKHGSHAIVADRSVSEQATDVEFFGADVAIATGNHTGDATPIEEIEAIKAGTSLPVLVGSGLTVENAQKLMRVADGAIVGSSVKHGGKAFNSVSQERVEALVREVNKLR